MIVPLMYSELDTAGGLIPRLHRNHIDPSMPGDDFDGAIVRLSWRALKLRLTGACHAILFLWG
jgi:hypothetical protein